MIKIDMEMPRYCDECESKFFDDSGYYHCCYTKRFCHSSKREEKCPLIEYEDEKSCETCKYLEIRKEYRLCNADKCEQYSNWERK